jgi:hypothetical protein
MMGYQEEDYRTVDGRKKGEPHPDANINLKYCMELLTKIDILEPSLSISYERVDPKTQIIVEPICIYFTWTENGELWSGYRSFHLPHQQFKEEICQAVNHLLAKKFAKRKGIPIGTIRNKPEPRMKEKSFAALFGEN